MTLRLTGFAMPALSAAACSTDGGENPDHSTNRPAFDSQNHIQSVARDWPRRGAIDAAHPFHGESGR